MSIRIATNVTALIALRTLDRNQQQLGDAVIKLASGSRVTTAADDAATLAISQGLTTQINGMVQAISNAQDATAVADIADGALALVHETLQRMRLLVLRAGNTGSGGPGSLAAASREVGVLTELLNAIADFTASGGHTLLDGGYRGTFQVGPAGGDIVVLDLSRADMHASNLGGGGAVRGIDLTAMNILGLDESEGIYSVEGMHADLATLSDSIVAVSTARSGLGAVANRLAHTVANLRSAVAAVTASRSSLTDADMAGEAQRLVSATITTFAAAAIVAQANSAPEAVLRLLDDSVGSGRGRGGADPRSGASGPGPSSSSDSGVRSAPSEPAGTDNAAATPRGRAGDQGVGNSAGGAAAADRSDAGDSVTAPAA